MTVGIIIKGQYKIKRKLGLQNRLAEGGYGLLWDGIVPLELTLAEIGSNTYLAGGGVGIISGEHLRLIGDVYYRNSPTEEWLSLTWLQNLLTDYSYHPRHHLSFSL